MYIWEESYESLEPWGFDSSGLGKYLDMVGDDSRDTIVSQHYIPTHSVLVATPTTCSIQSTLYKC